MTENTITLEDCHSILKSLLKTEYELQDYTLQQHSGSGKGFLGSALKLIIKVCIKSEIQTFSFFVKTVTENDFQAECTRISRVFYKEGVFYELIHSNIKKYLKYKSIPDYFLRKDELIVLEDLASLNFINLDIRIPYELRECHLALRALADVHSSLLIYEELNNIRINQLHPDILFLGWFSKDESHPGYKDIRTGIRSISVVIDVYFPNLDSNTKTEVICLLEKIPFMVEPSERYRNCVSHLDLWGNNIMFQGSQRATIVDFQIYGWNPPSLDLLMLIYINTDRAFREAHIQTLVDYYYEEVSSHLTEHGLSPQSVLSYQQFQDSFKETLPLAIGLGAVILAQVMVPESELHPILQDKAALEHYFTVDRTQLTLGALKKDDVTKKRVLNIISDVISYVENVKK